MTKHEERQNKTLEGFRSLSAAVAKLNKQSDEFGRSIANLDSVLQSIGPGVATWIVTASSDYWKREFGYAKVSGKWGLAVRMTTGKNGDFDPDTAQTYLFNDAPRWMRVDTIASFDELVQEMVQRVVDLTSKMASRVEQLNELTTCLSGELKLGDNK